MFIARGLGSFVSGANRTLTRAGRAVGRAITHPVETARSVGQKAGSAFHTVGQKISEGIGVAQKGINRGLSAASHAAQAVTGALGLQGVIGAIADSVRKALSSAVNALPTELRGPVETIYNNSPISNIVNSGLLSADVLAGRKDLTEEDIANVFPAYAVAREAIVTANNVSRGDKATAQRLLKRGAKLMIQRAIKAAI